MNLRERSGPDTNHNVSLREGAVAVGQLFRTRLELLLLDLEEEKERLEQRLVLAAIAGFLFALGSLVTTGLFVALLWPSLGVWSIAIFSALYLGGSGVAMAMLLRRNRERHPTFASTLREFEKDAERFARVLRQNENLHHGEP
jgi:uncharacterized membrane protein YqjE